MSYTPPHPLPMEWSTCSYRDQIKTFKEDSHRCMVSGGGGGGGGGGTCKCNGKSIQSGRYQGAGTCESGWEISCGAFCFVEKDACRDQIHLHGLEQYGYASCGLCAQKRSAEPLPTAACPRDSSSASASFIGTGVGLLAAGNYESRFNIFRQSIL